MQCDFSSESYCAGFLVILFQFCSFFAKSSAKFYGEHEHTTANDGEFALNNGEKKPIHCLFAALATVPMHNRNRHRKTNLSPRLCRRVCKSRLGILSL